MFQEKTLELDIMNVPSATSGLWLKKKKGGEMNKLNENELLYEVGLAFDSKKTELDSIRYDIPEQELKERRERINQAEVQIVALIKKPQVTEEWIQEKTFEMIALISNNKILEAMSFIRSLVEEIK